MRFALFTEIQSLSFELIFLRLLQACSLIFRLLEKLILTVFASVLIAFIEQIFGGLYYSILEVKSCIIPFCCSPSTLQLAKHIVDWNNFKNNPVFFYFLFLVVNTIFKVTSLSLRLTKSSVECQRSIKCHRCLEKHVLTW